MALYISSLAALPQLDRGSDYESERHRFESYTPHHLRQQGGEVKRPPRLLRLEESYREDARLRTAQPWEAGGCLDEIATLRHLGDLRWPELQLCDAVLQSYDCA